MSEMLGEVMAEGGLESLEPEDELDAFNDETFGGDGLGDQWEENAHEQLAMMTEEERMGLKQSDAFFNFGSDGEVSIYKVNQPNEKKEICPLQCTVLQLNQQGLKFKAMGSLLGLVFCFL